jgi:hypothetical protein
MLQGVGAGRTHKQVCLLASLQVLGGEDPREVWEEDNIPVRFGKSGKRRTSRCVLGSLEKVEYPGAFWEVWEKENIPVRFGKCGKSRISRCVLGSLGKVEYPGAFWEVWEKAHRKISLKLHHWLASQEGFSINWQQVFRA